MFSPPEMLYIPQSLLCSAAPAFLPNAGYLSEDKNLLPASYFLINTAHIAAII